MYGSCLLSIPFFSDADVNFVKDCLNNLSQEIFHDGEIILERNVVNEKLYLIKKGEVVLKNAEDQIIARLADNSYFGGFDVF